MKRSGLPSSAAEIPPQMLKLIAKSDRDALGLKTQEEAITSAEVKLEKDLHKLVAGVLGTRGIEYFHSRMDKRTTTQVGMPDFIFSVIFSDVDKCTQKTNTWPVACAWELKLPGKPLTADQQRMFMRMTQGPNAWCCKVIRSVDEALAELKLLGF